MIQCMSGILCCLMKYNFHSHCWRARCVKVIEFYLDHDKEREAIAKAGQQRTLSEHTYHNRMQELVEIVERYLQ